MISNEDEDEDVDYIYYNSLISLKLVSETTHPSHKDFYMIRKENLEQSLILKRCETPLLEYADLKESLFYIRNIDECLNIYGNKSTNISNNEQHNMKEYVFKNENKLNFNQNFILQHLMSKKFLTIDKIQGTDNYILKLVTEIEKAITFPFSFKRMNASNEFLSYKNIVYISIFNKEKGQNYYINHIKIDSEELVEEEKRQNNNEISEDKKSLENMKYGELFVINYNLDKFYIINQNWFINDNDSLYNGQLINIIFTGDKNKENDKKMLSVEIIKSENKNEELSLIKDEVKEEADSSIHDTNNKYITTNSYMDRIKEKLNSFSSINVKGIPYNENFYEHVINNSFWVIEKRTKRQDELNPRAIEISDLVRIKNPLLGLYLAVKKKNKDIKLSNDNCDTNLIKSNVNVSANNTNNNNTNTNIINNNINTNINQIIANNQNNNNINVNNNNINIINNNTSSLANNEKEELEFDLVTEETLENEYFNYNFKFFHYNVNEEKKISANGKYILKTVILNDNDNSKNPNKKKNKFGIQDVKSYFEPISLSTQNESDYIYINIEDDYILDITKIDFAKGNEVIFLQKIISDLDYMLKNCKKKKIGINSVINKITDNINFFLEYLLNIDYMFKNDNYEINIPVGERQLLLYKFNILNTIVEIINYFFPIVKDINSRDDSLLENTGNIELKQKGNKVKPKMPRISIQSLSKNKAGNQLGEDDYKIFNIKSMFKLILKFLIYLSKNKEDIKQDIFKILTQILEFAEYIYSNDKSDLLHFIFEILYDSESLQDSILSKKYQPNKIILDDNNEGILFIDKILSYIETNWNYLFYYKKLMHLNKIRYREEEIKEKIKLHIAKVDKDFRENKNMNNYKGKIFIVIQTITQLVNRQLKEWNNYLDEKDKEDKNEDPINSKEEEDYEDSNDNNTNININQILRRAKRSDNNTSNLIQTNSNKIDLDNDELISSNRMMNANSNDLLNGTSMFNPQNLRKKTLFATNNKANNIIDDAPNIIDKNKNKTFNLTNNIKEKTFESYVDLNNLNNKNEQKELAILAKSKISILNKVLDFLDYFQTINLDKILFRKEELFINMLKSDIKDEILENNLNFIINGNVCFIKFITELDFSTETTIGSIIPYYIYNSFYANDAKKYKDEEEHNSKKYIEFIENDDIDDSEENDEYNISDENEEKEEEEEKGNEKDITFNNNNEEDEKDENIEEGNNQSFSDKDIGEEVDNYKKDGYKSGSIFLNNNMSRNEKRRYTSNVGYSFMKKKKLKISEEEKDKESNKDLSPIIEGNEMGESSEINTRKRRGRKYTALPHRKEHFEASVKNLLREEAKKNEFIQFIEKSKEDNQKINKHLFILYSIYIFCANEFIEINYKFYKTLINYFINYDRFCKLNFLKIALNDIKKNILDKIIFINKNSFLNNIFDNIKLNPTLLEDNFALKNFIENNENFLNEIEKENKDKNISKKLDLNGVYKNDKLFNDENLVEKLKKLSHEEIILVDFLIHYCKINDQINYLIEKIECFKNIQKSICSSQLISTTNINNEVNKKAKEEPKQDFSKEIKELMSKLISNKFNILSLYEKLNLIKNNFLNFNKDSIRNNLLEDYGIIKQANFMLSLLEQYEIDRYFNKIIYLEIDQKVLQERNSFDKLMGIKELFQIIEYEIHKAKEENEKKNIDNKNKKANHYQIICNKLMSMTKKVLLNIFSGKEQRKEKIIQMLIKENENFFVKIGLLNTLKIMIESIEIYDLQYNISNDEKNEDNYILKLNYCKEVLRTFLEIQNTFPMFNNIISENLDICKKLIINSLKSIKDFQGNDQKKKLEEEKAFLCICYYCSEILLFILTTTKNTFSEVHGFILDIFNILKNIYDCIHSPKNIVTYQLFYNYLIIRMTVLLNKIKNKDTYSLEYFFKTIYNIKQMKIRILTCISHLQSTQENSSDKNFTIEKESSNIDFNKKKRNEEEEFQQWKDKLDKAYEFRVKNSIKSGENKTNNSKRTGVNQINPINLNTNEGFGITENFKNDIMWDNEEEKEKLMFFLYFTGIYIIYIKDKITGVDENENNLEDNDQEDLEFNFNSLTRKIKNLLDAERNIDESNIDNLVAIKAKKYMYNDTKSLVSSVYTKTKMGKFNKFNIDDNMSTVNNNTLYNNNYLFDKDKINLENNNITNLTKNNIPKCENRFSFELILLESIAEYKYRKRNKIIEIPVKNIEEKNENEFSNTDIENNSEQKEEQKDEQKQNEKQNEAKIKFYYYESYYIDLLFLEKIFKDTEVKKNLKYYCTNSYTNEEYEPLPPSKLLVVLFELQNRLENINIKQKKEYRLLYEQFIKNDMQKFIKYLLLTFRKNDIENIDIMGNFNFSRYNEIYPYDSLYGKDESEKILSLVDTLKKYEFELENDYFSDLIKSNNKALDNSILNLYKSDIVQFLNSLIYLYPHYDKKICLIFFRTGFMLLYVNTIKMDSIMMNKQSENKNDKSDSKNSELNLNSILNAIIHLFSRSINHTILETKNLFFLVLASINIFLRKIKDNHIFVSQNKELIQEFFHKIDFILNHLSNDFEKIANFMISVKSQQPTNKYEKIEQSLNYLINFTTTLISFKKIDKELLTEEIINFIQDIVEKMIKLIDLLLDQNKKTAFQTVDLLLNFIYYFVEGPDIENFKTLFNKGYYDLVSHSINKIDYYNLFFSNINKENLNEILDNKIEHEYRIIKILFVFYCLCHHEYKDTDEFIKMRHWFEENFKNIKHKLKKIYYLSKKEMENKEYELNKMLLFLKEDDSYSEDELRERYEIIKSESNSEEDIKEKKEEKKEEKKGKGILKKKNKNNLDENNENSKKIGDYDNINIKIKRNNRYSNYCLIKFDLILIYYSLFNYYQDSFNDEFLSVAPKQSIFQIIFGFLSASFNFIKYIVLCPFYFTYFIYKICTKKVKSNIELLQELSDIDAKCQILDEKGMIKFLMSKIKYIEISLDYRLFKVYYPLLNKSKQIQDNKDYYLQVDNNQLLNYVNHIMNSYDKINLIASQHFKIRKFFDLPVISIIFKNDNLYSFLLLILGFITNILIGISYSTFTTNSCFDYTKAFLIRRFCPHFLYNPENACEHILLYLELLGILMLVLQIILFSKYMIQTIAESFALYKNLYLQEQLKANKKYSTISYIIGFIPSFLKIFTNFLTIYYMLSLIFILMGIYLHPFFYFFVLFELVKRVEIMKIILKAMYVPLGNIFLTILLCAIMEYFFAVIAITIYQSHFPNIGDTKNMLSIFLRMFDQTFKKDGGVGTYLDITKEPGYKPFRAKYYAGTRFFFDVIFFLLINMIAFQIFFMIIIDYFSQSKEKTEEFTELSETTCLVCELEREDLEKIYSNSKSAFELHINHAHSLIDYISYLVYLQTLSFKDPIIEARIWKLHLSNNLNYLPKNVCFKQKEKEMLMEHLKK